MRGYGLPRNKDIEFPDVGDIQHYGFASHVGKFREKGGDFKSYIRNAAHKRTTRRHFKRIERMSVKHNINVALIEEY